MQMTTLLAQASNTGGAVGGLLYLLILIGSIAGMWKMFEKAGQPGWASLIPFYNIYIMLQIVGRPWWWMLLLFVPIVNFVVAVVVMLDLAKSFGQSTAFAIGLIFLGFIFIPILGFGDAEYVGAPN